jgi:catalase
VSDQAEQIVDAMNSIHGVHAGKRTVHAKGLCCRGVFSPSPNATETCDAAPFRSEVPVTVRFSGGSGKPLRADGAKDERGMAAKFHLPSGETMDMVSLTLPVFFVKTPEEFLEFLHAQRPDPATGKPDMERIGAFVADHPETQSAIGFVMFSMSPASFANCTFHGIHAFKYRGADGSWRYARYRWIPEADDATLTDEEARALGRDYLRAELTERLKAGTIAFELVLQLAGENDDVDDPTTAWPEERSTVNMGRLEIDEFADDECDPMIFDPKRLVDGIEPSEDPILHARSPAYSVSFARRTSA